MSVVNTKIALVNISHRQRSECKSVAEITNPIRIAKRIDELQLLFASQDDLNSFGLPTTLTAEVKDRAISIKVDLETLSMMLLYDPLAQKYSVPRKLYKELFRVMKNCLESDWGTWMGLRYLQEYFMNSIDISSLEPLFGSDAFHNDSNSSQIQLGHPPFEEPCISRALTLLSFQFGNCTSDEWNVVTSLIKILVQIINNLNCQQVTRAIVESDTIDDAHVSGFGSSENQLQSNIIMYSRWFVLCYAPMFCKSLVKNDPATVFGRKFLCKVFPIVRQSVEDVLYLKMDTISPSRRDLCMKMVPQLLERISEAVNDSNSVIWTPNFIPKVSSHHKISAIIDTHLRTIFLNETNSQDCDDFDIDMTLNSTTGNHNRESIVKSSSPDLVGKLHILKRVELESMVLNLITDNINALTDVSAQEKKLSDMYSQRNRLLRSAAALQKHVSDLTKAVGSTLQQGKNQFGTFQTGIGTTLESENVSPSFRFQRAVSVQVNIDQLCTSKSESSNYVSGLKSLQTVHKPFEETQTTQPSSGISSTIPFSNTKVAQPDACGDDNKGCFRITRTNDNADLKIDQIRDPTINSNNSSYNTYSNCSSSSNSNSKLLNTGNAKKQKVTKRINLENQQLLVSTCSSESKPKEQRISLPRILRQRRNVRITPLDKIQSNLSPAIELPNPGHFNVVPHPIPLQTDLCRNPTASVIPVSSVPIIPVQFVPQNIVRSLSEPNININCKNLLQGNQVQSPQGLKILNSGVSNPPTRLMNTLCTTWNSDNMIKRIPNALCPPDPNLQYPLQSNQVILPRLMLVAADNGEKNEICLSWKYASPDLSDRDTKKAEYYQIYSFQQPAYWELLGVVKALDLPMTCTLFKLNQAQHHFVVRGFDSCNHFSRFSNVVSILIMNS